MHQAKDICQSEYGLMGQKESYELENHCGYLVSFILAMSSFVNSI